MERPYFCAYHSYMEELEQLTDSEKGRLFVACLTYSMTGEVPQLRGNERFVFPVMKKRIDEDKQRFAELDRKQAENGRKGGRPRKKPQEAAGGGQSSEKPKKPTGFSENPKNPRVFTNSEETHGFSQFTVGTANERRENFDNSDFLSRTETRGFSQNTAISQKPTGFSEKQKRYDEEDDIETEDNDSLRSSSSSAKKDDDDDFAPENAWVSLGLGQRVGPAVSRALRDYRAKGVEDALIVRAMQRTAEYSTSAPLPYMRRILDQAVETGQLTLETWQSAHSIGRSAKRVDRTTPSGNDFLADAITRPRRHKRRE